MLPINMRANVKGSKDFPETLLRIGGRLVANTNGVINIPPFLGAIVRSKEELIDRVYPGVSELLNMHSTWLCNRAIPNK